LTAGNHRLVQDVAVSASLPKAAHAVVAIDRVAISRWLSDPKASAKISYLCPQISATRRLGLFHLAREITEKTPRHGYGCRPASMALAVAGPA